jgi:Ca-activated chloride channel family protein
MSRITTRAARGRRPAASEAPADRPPVALEGLRVEASIDGAMSEVAVEQAYRNAEDKAIEAVYTFPLPIDAVLLDIHVEIGGRRLRGSIVRIDQARETYEAAIGDGDGAFMLEQAEPGLFTLNAGNLRPGESARIRFSYAIANRWSGDRLRFFLPTTVAPRYGHWSIAPHAVPQASIMAENRFSLRIALGADLREARVNCPSHRLEQREQDGRTVLVLADESAAMDRDLVLEVRHAHPRPSFALVGEDRGGVVAMASFQPFMPGLERRMVVDAVAVIDCSGSMAGSSIAQARKAMDAVIRGLEPGDRMGMIAFGSSTRALRGGRRACDATGIEALLGFAGALDADLGGTEIGAALREAIAMAKGEARAADIFLVTDGEVANWEGIVEDARAAGVRVFAVGVGHAVHEAFLRALADATGGACEFVTPDEAMAGRIQRHFERMRAPRATEVAFAWPEGSTQLAPDAPPAIYAGDTVHAFARLGATAAPGSVMLEFVTEDGLRHRQRVELSGPVAEGTEGRPSTVARLAAAARLSSLPAEEAAELALACQLLSPHTAWVVVDERAAAEKTDGMPGLRRVEHMLAAGWGGAGATLSVMRSEIAGGSMREMTCFDDTSDLREARRPRTRRDDVVAQLLRDGGHCKDGSIAHAAGFSGEYDALRRGAMGEGIGRLAGMALELAILDALGLSGRRELQDIARARLAAELRMGLERLGRLEEMAREFERAAVPLLGNIGGVGDHLRMIILEARAMIEHARQMTGKIKASLDQQARG